MFLFWFVLFNYSGVQTEIFWENTQYRGYGCPGFLRRQVIISHGVDHTIDEKIFQLPVSSNCWEMMKKQIYFGVFPEVNSAQEGLSYKNISITVTS